MITASPRHPSHLHALHSCRVILAVLQKHYAALKLAHSEVQTTQTSLRPDILMEDRMQILITKTFPIRMQSRLRSLTLRGQCLAIEARYVLNLKLDNHSWILYHQIICLSRIPPHYKEGSQC